MSSAYRIARDWAEELARTWFLDAQGNDRLAFAGVEPGWAMRTEAYDALMRLALGALGSTSDAATSGILQLAKRLAIDRALRAWALRALRSGSAAAAQRSPVALITEIPTPSMLEPAILVARALRGLQEGAIEPAIGAADPRVVRIWRSRGFSPTGLIVGIGEERRLLRDGRTAAARAWREMIADPPAFQLHGRDLTEPALHALERLVKRSLPWLTVERAAVLRFLGATRPRSLAIASDQHRMGRVAVAAARELGIQTLVLQHGLPQRPLAYIPVVADMVAAWSQATCEWFITHGTPGTRLAVLGNPRTDAARRAIGEAGEPRDGHHPRVLVALSGSARATNEAVLRIALDAVAETEGLTMIVKLHPGSGGWGFVDQEIARRGLRDRVQVLQHEQLTPLIQWADATLLYGSTVALESLALDTPVILADVSEKSSAEPLLEPLRLPRVRSGAELIKTMVEQQHYEVDSEVRKRLVGPADGRSAERIARRLLAADFG